MRKTFKSILIFSLASTTMLTTISCSKDKGPVSSDEQIANDVINKVKDEYVTSKSSSTTYSFAIGSTVSATYVGIEVDDAITNASPVFAIVGKTTSTIKASIKITVGQISKSKYFSIVGFKESIPSSPEDDTTQETIDLIQNRYVTSRGNIEADKLSIGLTYASTLGINAFSFANMTTSLYLLSTDVEQGTVSVLVTVSQNATPYAKYKIIEISGFKTAASDIPVEDKTQLAANAISYTHVTSKIYDAASTITNDMFGYSSAEALGITAFSYTGMTYVYKVKSVNDSEGYILATVTISQTGTSFTRAKEIKVNGFRPNIPGVGSDDLALGKVATSYITTKTSINATSFSIGFSTPDLMGFITPSFEGYTYSFRIESISGIDGLLNVRAIVVKNANINFTRNKMIVVRGFKTTTSS